MVRAYSDASKRGERVSAAAIVVTDDMYVDSKVEILEYAATTYQGESYGFLLALQLVEANFPPGEHIEVYCDFQSIADYYNTYRAGGRISSSDIAYDDWVAIMNIGKKYDINVNYIQSHTKDRSYNTFCDYIARKALR